MVVNGALKDSGRWTRGTTRFVLVSEWLWVVGWKTVGQMGQEKLLGFYWLVNGCGWWTERQWDRWDNRIALGNKIYEKWFSLNIEWSINFEKTSPKWNVEDNLMTSN
jgi:hypothetical protein